MRSGEKQYNGYWEKKKKKYIKNKEQKAINIIVSAI